MTPGDVAAIADALYSLIVDEDLRMTLARAARARAEDFDITVWYQTLWQLWAQSVGRADDSTELLDQRTG